MNFDVMLRILKMHQTIQNAFIGVPFLTQVPKSGDAKSRRGESKVKIPLSLNIQNALGDMEKGCRGRV